MAVVFAATFIIVIGNWGRVIAWYARKRYFSLIPFLGGIGLAVCLYHSPARAFWWVGLLLDPGMWTGLAGLPLLIRQIIGREK